MRNAVQVRQVPAACPDYITTYAYACINNVQADRRPVKLRAYIGRESPADCFAERENRFWLLGGLWQNGFPVTISCSMKAARMLVDIRKLPERISSKYASGAAANISRNLRTIAHSKFLYLSVKSRNHISTTFPFY